MIFFKEQLIELSNLYFPGGKQRFAFSYTHGKNKENKRITQAHESEQQHIAQYIHQVLLCHFNLSTHEISFICNNLADFYSSRATLRATARHNHHKKVIEKPFKLFDRKLEHRDNTLIILEATFPDIDFHQTYQEQSNFKETSINIMFSKSYEQIATFLDQEQSHLSNLPITQSAGSKKTSPKGKIKGKEALDQNFLIQLMSDRISQDLSDFDDLPNCAQSDFLAFLIHGQHYGARSLSQWLFHREEIIEISHTSLQALMAPSHDNNLSLIMTHFPTESTPVILDFMTALSQRHPEMQGLIMHHNLYFICIKNEHYESLKHFQYEDAHGGWLRLRSYTQQLANLLSTEPYKTFIEDASLSCIFNQHNRLDLSALLCTAFEVSSDVVLAVIEQLRTIFDVDGQAFLLFRDDVFGPLINLFHRIQNDPISHAQKTLANLHLSEDGPSTEDDFTLSIASMFNQHKSLDQILLCVLNHAIIYHNQRYPSPDNVMEHLTLPFTPPHQHDVVLWMQQVMYFSLGIDNITTETNVANTPQSPVSPFTSISSTAAKSDSPSQQDLDKFRYIIKAQSYLKSDQISPLRRHLTQKPIGMSPDKREPTYLSNIVLRMIEDQRYDDAYYYLKQHNHNIVLPELLQIVLMLVNSSHHVSNFDINEAKILTQLNMLIFAHWLKHTSTNPELIVTDNPSYIMAISQLTDQIQLITTSEHLQTHTQHYFQTLDHQYALNIASLINIWLKQVPKTKTTNPLALKIATLSILSWIQGNHHHAWNTHSCELYLNGFHKHSNKVSNNMVGTLVSFDRTQSLHTFVKGMSTVICGMYEHIEKQSITVDQAVTYLNLALHYTCSLVNQSLLEYLQDVQHQTKHSDLNILYLYNNTLDMMNNCQLLYGQIYKVPLSIPPYYLSSESLTSQMDDVNPNLSHEYTSKNYFMANFSKLLTVHQKANTALNIQYILAQKNSCHFNQFRMLFPHYQMITYIKDTLFYLNHQNDDHSMTINERLVRETLAFIEHYYPQTSNPSQNALMTLSIIEECFAIKLNDQSFNIEFSMTLFATWLGDRRTDIDSFGQIKPNHALMRSFGNIIYNIVTTPSILSLLDDKDPYFSSFLNDYMVVYLHTNTHFKYHQHSILKLILSDVQSKVFRCFYKTMSQLKKSGIQQWFNEKIRKLNQSIQPSLLGQMLINTITDDNAMRNDLTLLFASKIASEWNLPVTVQSIEACRKIKAKIPNNGKFTVLLDAINQQESLFSHKRQREHQPASIFPFKIRRRTAKRSLKEPQTQDNPMQDNPMQSFTGK